jgi:two-component system response regulator AtoC
MGVDKILVVSGEPFIRKSIEECLRLRRYAVHGAGSLAEAERLLQRDFFDLLLLEMELPDGAGPDLFERLVGEQQRPLVVMLTASEGMESVAQCLRLGAFDYLLKPFGLNQVELMVRKAESLQQVLKVHQVMGAACNGPQVPGSHPSMERLQAQLRKLAPTDATILIEGEAGSGKTFFARQLHRESGRAGWPCLEVDCQGIPEPLLESRIFGHEKGAISDPNERREGHLELADSGTLLLESVDALPPRLQDKLLRFLLSREYERRGGVRALKGDVRVVATVRGTLRTMLERGAIQESLFHRLNVLPLRIPALRERGDDVLLLADAFLAHFARRHGTNAALSQEAREALRRHPWRGNVRELEIAIERAVMDLATPGTISPADLGLTPEMVLGDVEVAPFASMHELERQHIFRAIDRAQGNRTKAADLLGISVRTLRNKLHEYRALEAPAVGVR